MPAQPTTSTRPPAADTELTAALRRKLELRQSRLLARLGDLGEDSGKLLFELRWLSADEVRSAYRARRRRTWLGLLEAVVFAVLTAAGLLLLAVLVGDMFGI